MWWWNGPPPMWGMGWIFPLIGIVFIVVILFVISRFFGRGDHFVVAEDTMKQMT